MSHIQMPAKEITPAGVARLGYVLRTGQMGTLVLHLDEIALQSSLASPDQLGPGKRVAVSGLIVENNRSADLQVARTMATAVLRAVQQYAHINPTDLDSIERSLGLK